MGTCLILKNLGNLVVLFFGDSGKPCITSNMEQVLFLPSGFALHSDCTYMEYITHNVLSDVMREDMIREK